MKVLTWNASKAGESQRKLWEMAQREDADIVLLQEVTGNSGRTRSARSACPPASSADTGGHHEQ